MAPKKKKSSRYNWVSIQREEGLLCIPSWRETTIPLENGGYILNKVLYASIISDHVVTDCFIPEVSETVYIHPDTMKQCSIMINQPVVVMETTNMIITVSKAWPMKSLDLHRVSLNKHLSSRLQCKGCNGVVSVEALSLTFTVPVIKEMTLNQISENKTVFSDTFKNYLVFNQEGGVLSLGSIISISFHGQEHTFTVQSLTTTNITTKPGKTCNSTCNNDELATTSTNTCETKKGDKEIHLDSSRMTINSSIATTINSTINSSTATCTINSADTSLIEPLSSLSLSSSTPLKKTVNDSSSLSSPSLSTTPQLVNYDDTNSMIDETPPLAPPIPHAPVPSQRLAELIFGKVTLSTKVKFTKDNEKSLNEDTTSVPSLNDIGGLKEVIRSLKELVLYPFLYPSLINKGGVVFPNGLLLHGPPGTGKSLLASAIARQTSIPYKVIHYTDVIINEKEEGSYLSQILSQAREESPCIVIINDIHRICPQKEDGLSQGHSLSAFIKHFDQVAKQPGPHMVVLATTNDLNSVHVDLRRPGKFEVELEVPAPIANEREEILKLLLRGFRHCMSDSEIKDIAVSAHGHVGADLKAVCLKAQQLLLRTHFDSLSLSSPSTTPCIEKIDMIINYTVMRRALQLIQPTAMREITVEVPRVLWSDIGGEEEIKKELREATEWSIKHPEALQRMGLDPPRGILLYGPPGCSKTMIVRALATESGFNFLSIKGPEIFTKWVGDSERAIRQLFSRARAAAPSIIFFDEIDSIATHRQGNDGGSKVGDRVLTQLLTEIDGVELLKGVLIVAATNRPDIIDKALLRSGRIDKKIYVPLPCPETRKAIFKISFKKTPIDKGVDIEQLVKRTETYSGAEVVAVVQRAAQLALSEDINTVHVSEKHFELALNDVKPSTDLCTLKLYEDFQKNIK